MHAGSESEGRSGARFLLRAGGDVDAYSEATSVLLCWRTLLWVPIGCKGSDGDGDGYGDRH